MNRNPLYHCPLAAACYFVACLAIPASAASLVEAENLLLRGNYEESAAAFGQLRESAPVLVAVGMARSFRERGMIGDAREQLQLAVQNHADAADLHAELASVALLQGDEALAGEHVQHALALDADHLQARWLQAELLRMRGSIAEARKEYRWLSEFYDEHGRNLRSPRDLHWLGLGIAQHARFNRKSNRFPQLVDQLYPAALKLQPNFWPAHHAVGLLLLEKFNEADADVALRAALRINPHSADIQTALAQLALEEFRLGNSLRHLDQALKTNPAHLPAFWCRADVQLASLLPDRALLTLQEARRLNPHSVQTLGRLAACRALLPSESDALPSKDATGSSGEFQVIWAEALDRNRRFPLAAERLRRAIALHPERVGPRGRLGMIEMRLGHEQEARRLLIESFALDPYNVRVKNQLEVLDLLDDYTTLETKHFLIRFDPNHASHGRLARCVALEVESIYDEFAELFQFDLPEKALLEIFGKGRGVSGQQWFGARMAGLPNIRTIAACSGNVVALAPSAGTRGEHNWHDILRHELVHLFNLQQTGYNMPHWFTEGCAVWLENRPRRPQWDKLLVDQSAKQQLLDLTSIDLGFIRPRSAAQRQLAYCQAELYVEYLLDQHGRNSLRHMLAAYQQNLSTSDAVQQALGISCEQFQGEYDQFLGRLVETLARRRSLRPEISLAQAKHQFDASADDPKTAAQLALARLRRGDYPEARRLAEAALQQDPKNALARYVQAQLLIRRQKVLEAIELLLPNLRQKQPDPASLELLAGLELRRGNLAEAERAYRLGAKTEPENLVWVKALAVVAVKMKDESRLSSLLTQIAQAEPENLVARKKRWQLALRTENQNEIALWSSEVLHIDPDHKQAHRILSESLPNQPQRAAEHAKMAKELAQEPKP